MTILVTGFGPYKEDKNASEEMVTSLMKDPSIRALQAREQVVFDIVRLDQASTPRESETLEQHVERLLAEYKPRVCIFTGQAPFRNKITVERFGLNIFMGQRIDIAGPVGYWSNLPGIEELPAVLNQRNIPASHSTDNGDHLCNHILFSALRLAETRRLEVRAGFVHIPITPEQVTNVKGYRLSPYMSTELAKEALACIIDYVMHYKS